MKHYFVLFLFFPFQCVACSCVREPYFDKAYDAAEYVVEAEIMENRNFNHSKNKFKLQVTKYYKGGSAKTINVWSEKDSPSGGMDFSLNEEYIVFFIAKKEN